jgi:polyphosphate glucokinase
MKAKPIVLAIDIGGTNVKILASGQTEPRKFPSGKDLTPRKMVAGVKKLAGDWEYDVVSIGYPGHVVADSAVTEPRNLARGWIGFDFAAAFGRPVKVINDAAMQALGSYKGGTMLFLGLGTGLGSALMVRGHIVPMELGALSYKNKAIEDYLGIRGLEKLGKKKWRKTVAFWVKRFTSALLLDDVVIGGGNAKKLKQMPPGCRLGNNDKAFLGGFRMWKAWSARGNPPHANDRMRMTRQRRRKDPANERSELIADGTPVMEGAGRAS